MYQALKALPGQADDRRVVSLIGGKDSAVDARCISLRDADHDGMLKTDMDRNQWFRISRVDIKIMTAQTTDPSHTAAYIERATSRFEIIRPDIDPERIYALQTFDVCPVTSATNVSSFRFDTTPALRQFGIDWCPCSEWDKFGGHEDLYMKQLQAGRGGSAWFNIIRNSNVIGGDSGDYARILVVYHITYRGPKGSGDLS